MTQKASALHTELVEFGTENYREVAIDLWIHECADGVPGIEIDEAGMKGFFDQMPPEQWLQLAAANPSAALAMLNQYKAMS